jgi:uncharacterized OB-fold protein
VTEWHDWWEATERPVLLVQTCEECGHRQHYPRAVCLDCGADRLGWIEASGNGTVYSFTVSHLSPDPERFEPPYVVALVDLTEGVRLVTRIVTSEPDSLQCGQEATLTWIPAGDGRHLPAFKPLEKETAT